MALEDRIDDRNTPKSQGGFDTLRTQGMVDMKGAQDEATLRMRTDASTGMIPKSNMQVAGLGSYVYELFFGKTDAEKTDSDKDSSTVKDKSDPKAISGGDTVPPAKIDPSNPSEDAVKFFETRKEEIKKECEEKLGAGNSQCSFDTKPQDAKTQDGTQPQQLLNPTDTKAGNGATGSYDSSHHSSGGSGFNNALLWWWIMSNNSRSTSSPNYYEHRSPVGGVGAGAGAFRPSAPATHSESPHVAPAGRNPVTGIPNVGRPSGFGSTGGARVGGSVGGG